MTAENKAKFVPIEIGIEDSDRVEVRNGLSVGDTVVTNGASSLRDNDTLVMAGQRPGQGGPPAGGGQGRPGGGQGRAPRGPGAQAQEAPAGAPAAPPASNGPAAPAEGGARRRPGL